MKNIFDNCLMQKSRSENSETRFWSKFDMSKVSELAMVLSCREGRSAWLAACGRGGAEVE